MASGFSKVLDSASQVPIAIALVLLIGAQLWIHREDQREDREDEKELRGQFQQLFDVIATEIQIERLAVEKTADVQERRNDQLDQIIALLGQECP